MKTWIHYYLVIHSLVWRKTFSSHPNLPFSASFSLENKFSANPSLVVETVDPLLPFSAKFSLEKKLTVDPLLPFSVTFSLEKKFSSKPSLFVEPVDPLLIFSVPFSLEKKVRSQPSLVIKTVEPLLPFSTPFSLENKFSAKPSLVVETVNPLLPCSSKFIFAKNFRSKQSLVVKQVDPLLPFSLKISVEKKVGSKPQVDSLLPCRATFSLANIDQSVTPTSNIRSESSLVTNTSCTTSSNLSSSVLTFKNSIFTLPTTQVLGVHVQYLLELHQNKSLLVGHCVFYIRYFSKTFFIEMLSFSLSTATESIVSSQPVSVSLRDRFPTWIIDVDTIIASKCCDKILYITHHLPRLLSFILAHPSRMFK